MKTTPNPHRLLFTGAAALLLAVVLVIATAVAQESAPEELPKGVGPIQNIELGEIDPELAAQGEEIFNQFCTGCHKLEERYVGPALQGVTERRAPEWIMNMILNPDVMIMEDETAYNLFAEYLTPMANQNLTEEQARAVLEYFRTVDEAAAEGADAE